MSKRGREIKANINDQLYLFKEIQVKVLTLSQFLNQGSTDKQTNKTKTENPISEKHIVQATSNCVKFATESPVLLRTLG